MAHLETLRFTGLKVRPDPVRIASEGALWGRIVAMGLLEGTIIVSDGAGQFRVGDHALCWVHSERLVYKLDTFCEHQRRAKERIRHRIWWLYADIKDYCHDPTPEHKYQLRRRFDSIFTTKTGFVTLDRLLKRHHRRKEEFLAALERPVSRCTPTARKTISAAKRQGEKSPAAPAPTWAAIAATAFSR